MKRRPWKRVAVVGVVTVLLGMGLASGYALNRAADSKTAEGRNPLAIVHQGDRIVVPPGSELRSELVVKAVGVTDRPRELVLPASVEADPARTINILPPVTGRISELLVRLGDHVVKGQPLAVLDSGDLAQAYADHDKAEDEVKRTSRVLERARGLNRTGAGAMKDLEQAESDYEEARVELTRAEARLKEIGVKAGKGGESRLLTLVAPTTGSVTALMCSPGTFANDTTAAIMTIANLDSVWVTAAVPENDVAFVVKGQAVEVSFPAYPGDSLHGRVAFASEVMEPDTHRCKVRMAFPNKDGKLKPNMFATARFKVAQERAVFVPNSALLMNNDSTVVFVEVEPWTFVRRQVVPGYGEGEGARIPSGLTAGDRIIVKGGVLLND
jgi:membrane fusion protein, heavy metal efflux system